MPDKMQEWEARYQQQKQYEAQLPPLDYDYNPQAEGFEHTPAGGRALLELLHRQYPAARLVGSVAAGCVSLKDVDVLIPLRTLAEKQQCVAWLRATLRPSHMAQPRGNDGLGLVAKPHGAIDIFFNDRHR